MAKSKKSKTPAPPSPEKVEPPAQDEEAARIAEEQRLRDQDEEDERARQDLETRTRAAQPQVDTGAPAPMPGKRDTTPVVIEYIGPERAPFPVMFGTEITWLGRDIRDGLKPWQGRVERWYAEAIMAREPGWWKVLKITPPPPLTAVKKPTMFASNAWMTVRTLEDVEVWAKKIARSTPPARIAYLRKMVQQFRLVQSEEQAAAIDEYVNMYPAEVQTPADQPRVARLVAEEDADFVDDADIVVPAATGAAEDDADADEEDFQ